MVNQGLVMKEWKDPAFWENLLRRNGALWEHDGDPRRPYALLTGTGKKQAVIADSYVDFTHIAARTQVLRTFAEYLRYQLEQHRDPFIYHVFVGQAFGSLFPAYELARQFGANAAWMKKVGSRMVLDDRFRPLIKKHTRIVIVEDAASSLGTSEVTRQTLEDEGCRFIEPYVVSFVDNQNQLRTNKRRVISACQRSANYWLEGDNPHTPDGQELLRPIKPKTKRGRQVLHKKYKTPA